MTQVTPHFQNVAGYVCLRLAENCDIQQKRFLLRAEVKWSEQTRSYWRQLSDKIMSPIHALIGTKNIFERICGAYETHVLHLTLPFCTYCVHATHHFSKSHGFHETHIVCLTHTFSKMVFMKHILCLTHFYSKSYGVHETVVFKMTENHLRSGQFESNR
jgi:hypothetical protein